MPDTITVQIDGTWGRVVGAPMKKSDPKTELARKKIEPRRKRISQRDEMDLFQNEKTG